MVAVFPSLEGESLEDYVNRLFERWKLGQKDRDNGVLLAIFLDDRKARIEVGYGLEGVLTDALASRILRERLIPEFREKRYAEGIEATVAAIEAATRGEYSSPQRKEGFVRYLPFVLFLGFWLLMAISIVARRGALIAETLTSAGSRRYRGRPWADPARKGGAWWVGSYDGGGGGGWSGGGGGGFSGGGGSSGGGGASGGW